MLPSTTPPTALPKDETGDEAYQRRLAMSQARVMPVSEPEPIRIPSPEPEKTLSFNPFAPPFVPPPPAPAPDMTSTATNDPDFEARVKHSRDAAAAVAARLAKIASAAAEGNGTAGDESTPPTEMMEERYVKKYVITVIGNNN